MKFNVFPFPSIDGKNEKIRFSRLSKIREGGNFTIFSFSPNYGGNEKNSIFSFPFDGGRNPLLRRGFFPSSLAVVTGKKMQRGSESPFADLFPFRD